MSFNPSVQSAWDAYQSVVNDLYNPPSESGKVADRSVAEIYTEHLEERSDVVIANSEQFRTTLVTAMETDDSSQRELAALKLLAAAAYDLSVANDLMELERVKSTSQFTSSQDRASVAFPRELRDILDAPIDDGIVGILTVDRDALPVNSQAARIQLEETIARFLRKIPENAAELSQTAIAGFIDLGLGVLPGVASMAVQEILAHVPEGVSLVTQRAAALIAEAVRKIRSGLGREQEEQIEKEVSNWLDDVKSNRDTVTSLLNKLYETTRIGEETKKLVENAPSDTEAGHYNQATETLEELLARYSKTKSTLNSTMRVLAFLKPTLMGAVPWGPLSVYAAYSSFLAYAVYSGGDYLDWDRTGDRAWLDRVKGMRATVREALNAPSSGSSPKDATKGHDRDGDPDPGPGSGFNSEDDDSGSGPG